MSTLLGERGPRLVPTAGGRISWRVLGEGEPILLIHGIPSSSVLWERVAPALASNYEVHTIDLLGYGQSEQPEDSDLGLRAQSEYLAELLASIDWPGGVVVGHDIGGGIAQLLALNPQPLVTQLVLVDSVAYDSFPEPGIARLAGPEWDEIIQRIDLAAGFRKGLTRGVRDATIVTDDLVQAYAAPFEGDSGRRAYLRCARALRTAELLDAMDLVEELTVPTLLVWGDSDDFQPESYGQRLAHRMANARFVSMRAGHFLPLELGVELAAVIEHFISENNTNAETL